MYLFTWKIVCKTPKHKMKGRILEAFFIKLKNPSLNNQLVNLQLKLFQNCITLLTIQHIIDGSRKVSALPRGYTRPLMVTIRLYPISNTISCIEYGGNWAWTLLAPIIIPPPPPHQHTHTHTHTHTYVPSTPNRVFLFWWCTHLRKRLSFK